MSRFERREVRFALREFVFLALAAMAAWLFVNHELLRGQPAPANAQLSWYLISTVVIYLYLRAIVIVVEMRTPRARTTLVRCPECGQWLDDPSASDRQVHNRIELTPKPSHREVVSAVALRKAVDAARLVPGGAKMAVPRIVPDSGGPMENVTSKDLLDAIDDPDLLERLLHSPNPPANPRLKR